MAAEKGSAFLLKIGDGAQPPAFATVAGLRTTQMSVNGEPVNVTSKDSGGWRELLSGAGVRSVSVAGSGIFTGSAAEIRLKSNALAGLIDGLKEIEMAEATARFALPFLIPGQAQKELFHNEALAVLDSVLQAAVEGPPQASPPASPVEGQCWVVAAAASGAWSGKEGSLAAWTSGGWRFVAPRAGMSVWNKADALTLRYDGAAWNGGELIASSLMVGGVQVVGERLAAIASPSGGTIIDVEARGAVSAVIAALMSHGLID